MTVKESENNEKTTVADEPSEGEALLNNEQKILEAKLGEALPERYLAYAMSTIVSRSLPDVRDGLKPVHRRLLYAMRELGLDATSGFKKCARVVGDVIGKYHPHGDVAVYDTMVRLAQSFAVRYPLVEGQGNFGNVDGDRAAAMRYTEARLTAAAEALMEGLDDDAVDFRPTYSGDDIEPVVMPAAFPNLLANGSSGIAVGMATNIPPHNLGELCNGLQYLIKHPDCSVADLMKYIPAPDFPTGGVIVESKENLLKAYETGRGAIKLRAKWEKEEQARGVYDIVITEIPYGVAKSDLIAKIAKLLLDKKLPLINDVRDESAEEIRIVIEPKSRTVDAEQVMEHLFRQSDLQINFNLNMNVLDAGQVPKVMNLKEVLAAFLAHRQNVLVRRATFRKGKIEHRMEVLEGFLIAYLNLDRVIQIIRTEDEPKPIMMAEFKITDVQAEAILNMKLRSLRKLEEAQINDEHAKLAEELAGLVDLLANEDIRWKAIAGELAEIKKKFGQATVVGKRRSLIADAPVVVEVPIDVMVEKEPITVLLSKQGWIRAIKGYDASLEDLKFKDGDSFSLELKTYTTDRVVFFADNGRFYTVTGDKFPRGRGFGEPVRLFFDLPEDAKIIKMFVFKSDMKLLVASLSGKGFIVPASDVFAQTRAGKTVLNLNDKDKAAFCIPVPEGADTVAIIGQNRRMLMFKLAEIPEMLKGKGVILQKYKGGKVSDIKLFKAEDGLAYPASGGTRIERNLIGWMGKRAGVGKLPPVGFPRTNKFEK